MPLGRNIGVVALEGHFTYPDIVALHITNRTTVNGHLDIVYYCVYTDNSLLLGVSAMICPVCKNDMIDVEHERIELDYCTNCHGVWFDAEELELLLESMGVENHGLDLDNIWHSPETETEEKKRKCSICGQKMKKAAIGKEPEVLIDVCPQGDGLWFDGGEVGHLITRIAKKPSAKPDSEARVITFLGEVFHAQE
jgi:hypothetical protein